jgi:hypothetical protein
VAAVTQLDLLAGVPLPTRGRTTRARTRCAAEGCGRPVYVDQLVYGLGRCCAEKAGLIVIRHRFPHQRQQGESLLDHLPEGARVEPFPQIRIDVAGLPARDAHTKIVEHARSMIADPTGELAKAYPNGMTAATDDAFRGLVGILERHAPRSVVADAAVCDRDYVTGTGITAWPCDDYRDAAAGLATGLPAAAAA